MIATCMSLPLLFTDVSNVSHSGNRTIYNHIGYSMPNVPSSPNTWINLGWGLITYYEVLSNLT